MILQIPTSNRIAHCRIAAPPRTPAEIAFVRFASFVASTTSSFQVRERLQLI